MRFLEIFPCSSHREISGVEGRGRAPSVRPICGPVLLFTRVCHGGCQGLQRIVRRFALVIVTPGIPRDRRFRFVLRSERSETREAIATGPLTRWLCLP